MTEGTHQIRFWFTDLESATLRIVGEKGSCRTGIAQFDQPCPVILPSYQYSRPLLVLSQILPVHGICRNTMVEMKGNHSLSHRKCYVYLFHHANLHFKFESMKCQPLVRTSNELLHQRWLNGGLNTFTGHAFLGTCTFYVFVLFKCASCSLSELYVPYITNISVTACSLRAKAVPLHAMVALGWKGGVAPTHSRPRH